MFDIFGQRVWAALAPKVAKVRIRFWYMLMLVLGPIWLRPSPAYTPLSTSARASDYCCRPRIDRLLYTCFCPTSDTTGQGCSAAECSSKPDCISSHWATKETTGWWRWCCCFFSSWDKLWWFLQCSLSLCSSSESQLANLSPFPSSFTIPLLLLPFPPLPPLLAFPSSSLSPTLYHSPSPLLFISFPSFSQAYIYFIQC